ncbi:MAG: glycosyltransferase [Chlamydiota bacterium]
MLRVLFCAFIVLSWSVECKTICLNMIVKNEKEVIEKCLNSVKPIIDYWVIVDTGSTDGTQEAIKNCMQSIPGELHERGWVNFEHNRNEALTLAQSKGDYLLMIDADEVLQYSDNFALPILDKDGYYMHVRELDAVDFQRMALIKSALAWKWVGILHETLECPDMKAFGVLNGLINICNTNAQLSGRSKDPKKYLKDAEVLEEALKKDPDNSRNVFYLAQSYYAAKEYKLALKNYQKRSGMPSSDEQETFFALYNIGKLQEVLQDYDSAIQSFFKAHFFRPTRAEPLLQLATLYRKTGNCLLGYLLSKHALTFSRPLDSCIEYSAYDYAILVEAANCALLLGKWEEGLELCDKLLINPNLPPDIKPKVIANSVLAKNQLKEQR